MLPDVKRMTARSCDFDDLLVSSKSVSWHSVSCFRITSIKLTANPCAANFGPNLALVIRGEPGKRALMLSSCPVAVFGSSDTGLMIAPTPPAAVTAQNQTTFSRWVSKYVMAIWPGVITPDSRKAVPYLYRLLFSCSCGNGRREYRLWLVHVAQRSSSAGVLPRCHH